MANFFKPHPDSLDRHIYENTGRSEYIDSWTCLQEVDEESEEACMVAPTPDRERRRPDVLDDQLVRFAEFRRRRARRERDVLRERTEEPAPGTVQRDDDATTNAAAFSSATPRAGSEPAVLSLVDT
ncbi:unnamed protein product [Diatraea saccharalis]|uniref:Uncharacterized protein n=1 Tax=Diatraea saccharalis TaxID=40085 RepID=A0A9P0C4T3_9NEOP|nr:unnamed protein product [Diatraea saccharalis]